MICVSLGKTSPEQALLVCGEVQLVEIRADLLKWSEDDFRKIIHSPAKSIFTCRPGVYSEKERSDLFKMAAEEGAHYIDIEFESEKKIMDEMMEIRNKFSTQLIISYHNYKGTPGRKEMEDILEDCYHKQADVAKLACQTYSQSDVARLLSLYEIKGRKVILGMGEAAKITRVAALWMGAEFTFASTGSGSETAEGQIDYKTMQEITRLINIRL